ncbi:hypothetical protein MesoLjLc_22020 [Mesorhizobium sp. L-8-10]|nr:hypothetical protein MesoLjLc_22020 [Mesorhizobium sp. L-8-10]
MLGRFDLARQGSDVMKPNGIPSSELEFLVGSEGLKSVFEEIEREAFEELLRLPWWASRKRMAALLERVRATREVQARIRALKALRSRNAGQRA